MKNTTTYKCSYCKTINCKSKEDSKLPVFCPMINSEDILENTFKTYIENEQIQTLALEASRNESEGYFKWTRIEETLNFAHRLRINNIGIAHCIGLAKEAQIVHKIFHSNGFKVNSICCKVGKIDKEKLGLKNHEKVVPGQYESACNPIAQAKILEKAGCELNILMGLCIGHDSLFFMHTKTLTTVLVVKDRVLGHNPVAALYTSHSYYRNLKNR